MGMSSGGGGALPSINVTPLIDILLVLLIIFMVITPLKPARFKTLVPERSEEMSEQAKQSPRTLVVNVKKDQSAELLRGGNHVVDGSVSDPGPIGAALGNEFKTRKEQGIWNDGFEGRTDLPPDS